MNVQDTIFNYRVKNIVLILIMLLLVFQNVLVDFFDFFTYFDEVICLASILMLAINGKIKANMKIIICLFFFIILGLFGNFISSVNRNYFSIVVDILSIEKIFFVYMAFSKVYTSDDLNQISNFYVKFIVIFDIICFAFLLFTYAGVFNMH